MRGGGREGSGGFDEARFGDERPAGMARAAAVALLTVAAMAAVVALLVVPGLQNPDARDGRLLVPVNSSTFPDAAWRAYVSDRFDADGDGFLSPEETDGVTAIGAYAEGTYEVTDEGVADRGIRSLRGLEFFPNVEMLEARDNDLVELDIRRNPRLARVDVRGNPRFDLRYGAANADAEVLIDEDGDVVSETGERR